MKTARVNQQQLLIVPDRGSLVFKMASHLQLQLKSKNTWHVSVTVDQALIKLI